MGAKYALLIANTEYLDSSLAQLSAPGKDSEEFARVLRSPEICAFDTVTILLNETESVLRESIDEFFDAKKPDDLLLLYFSGHGIRDEVGALYLAVRNTNHLRLRATAIKSDFIRESMDHSRSKRQVLILDCCNSGAFAQGTKAATGGSVGTASAFEGTGYGRIVLTASDSTQFAWEGDRIIGETQNSLFTHFLIKGLEGEADKNRDGEITIDELYEYAYDQIVSITPKMTPGKWSYKQQGEILLRQLSQEQREERRRRKLEEEQRLARLAQEEADKLAQARADREAALKEVEKLREERELAERDARAAAESALHARQGQTALDRQRLEATPVSSARPESVKAITSRPDQPARNPIRWIMYGLAAVLGLFGIYYSITNFPAANPQSSGSTTANTAQVTDASVPLTGFDSPSFTTPAATESKSRFSLPENSPLPIDSMPVLSPENAAQITGITRWGGPVINELQYSPSGDVIAAATLYGVSLYDSADLVQIHLIETDDLVTSMTFSPDGSKLLIGLKTGGIQMWDVQTGLELPFYDEDYGMISDVLDLAYTPDGNLIASASYSGILLLDTEGYYYDEIEDLMPNGIKEFDFSSDGKYLALISDYELRIWSTDPSNPGQFTLLHEIKEHITRPEDVSFSADGGIVLVTGGETVLWRTSDGLQIRSLSNPFDAALSPVGNSMAVSTYENVLELTDPRNSATLARFSETPENLENLTFDPTGKKILGTSRNRIQIWDIASGKLEKSNKTVADTASYFTLSPDGKTIASGDWERGMILLRNASTGGMIRELVTQESYIYSVSFTSENDILYEGENGEINLYDLNAAEVRQLIAPDEFFYFRYHFSPSGKYAAYINTELKEIKVLDLQTGSEIQIFSVTEEEAYSIYEISISPDGSQVAAPTSSSLKVWNTATGELVWSLHDVEYPSPPVYFGGGEMLAYYLDEKIVVADSLTGEIIKTFQSPNFYLGSIQRSPDGNLLMASSGDGYVYIWNYNDGSLVTGFKTTSGNNEFIDPVFSSDGKYIIVLTKDGTLQVWGVLP